MKSIRYIVPLIVSVCITLYTMAQKKVYDAGLFPHGLSLLYSDNEGVELGLSIQEFEIARGLFSGQSLHEIKTNGVILFNESGAPDLPVFSAYLAIPEGSTPEIQITLYDTDTLFNIDLRPAPVIPSDNDTGDLSYVNDPAIYFAETFYPSGIAAISPVNEIRGTDCILLGVNPFRYNPVSKTLLVHYNIRISIRFTGGKGVFGDDRLRSLWWEPIQQDVFLNASSLPPFKQKQYAGKGLIGYEYLVITLNKPEFLAWADSLRKFRTEQGILTGVITIDEACGNDTWLIDQYIRDIYNNWDIPPAAVLLLADYDNGNDGITSSHLIHEVSGSYISDNFFADVNDDHLPDIAFARIVAENAEQLERMIRKILDYERTPPVDPGFYDHPVTALGWETARWFQLCSEVINGFWEFGLGKQPVRENCIFWGTPGGVWSTAPNTEAVVNYFGPYGQGYIPDNSAHLTDWEGSAARINSDINSGAFMVQHRDHGLVSGWGEPYYRSFHIPGLYNENPTFVFSVNCLTGKFNAPTDCFQEVFQRHIWGALGVIAATEESFSFVNDTYVWGMYDYMWPGFMPDFGSNPESRGVLPCFGNVAGKYFLQQSAWPYNTSQKNITYNLFHHHGDAFMTVYTELPQALSVAMNTTLVCTDGGLTITSDINSLIALTRGDEILATALGSGSQQFMPVDGLEPGMKLRVTVTKQNYFRYSSLIDVIAPDGPHVIVPEYSFDEVTGHPNHIAEPGESILLNVTLKNTGNQLSQNSQVIVSCDSPFITISDNSENFGDIYPGQLKAVDHGFSLTISENMDSSMVVPLVFTISTGQQTWISEETLRIVLPSLRFRGFSIDDAFTDNNHQLSPGETVGIVIGIENKGAGTAWQTGAQAVATGNGLQILNPWLMIDSILPGETGFAIFHVAADEGVPAGFLNEILVTVETNNTLLTDTFCIPIGRYTENWESALMTNLPWQSTGDAGWYVSRQDSREGYFSARSGFVIDEQSTALQLDYTSALDDSVRFYLNVSSEYNWDFFRFYIDDVMMDEWSGESGWIHVTFPLTAGPHTLKWVYDKDMFLTTGRDCAFVDLISLPPCPLVFAGNDTVVCENLALSLNGRSAYCSSPSWTGTGDGTFDDPTNPLTQYHFGEADILSGEVFLIFTANTTWGPVTDTFQVGIAPLPDSPGNISGPELFCQGTQESLYWIPLVPGAGNYEWSITPPQAGETEASNSQCVIHWNPAFSGNVTVIVQVSNNCGYAAGSSFFEVTAEPLPVVSLGLPVMVQIADPPLLLEGGLPEGGIYSGSGVYNGYFYPNVAGEGTHILCYSYTDGSGCENMACDSITVDAGTRIEEIPPDALLSPNPFTRFLDISVREFTGKTLEIQLKDSRGVIVFSETSDQISSGYYRINTQHLRSGPYFLYIRVGSEAIYSYQVIKSD